MQNFLNKRDQWFNLVKNQNYETILSVINKGFSMIEYADYIMKEPEICSYYRCIKKYDFSNTVLKINNLISKYFKFIVELLDKINYLENEEKIILPNISKELRLIDWIKQLFITVDLSNGNRTNILIKQICFENYHDLFTDREIFEILYNECLYFDQNNKTIGYILSNTEIGLIKEWLNQDILDQKVRYMLYRITESLSSFYNDFYKTLSEKQLYNYLRLFKEWIGINFTSKLIESKKDLFFDLREKCKKLL